MWRRAVSSSSTTPQLLLRKLSPPSAAPSLTIVRSLTTTSSATTPPHSHTLFSAPLSGNTLKKVEDVMPIATGHEREELEAALQGRNVLEINYPVGPFGTKPHQITELCFSSLWLLQVLILLNCCNNSREVDFLYFCN
ncbi:cytochrome c oxidase subunit 5b-2, mitochondrial-like isoform X5 [Quercus robur]|uniref:cytochrome c oxidase subunit 5b-2, mitochondrial-like isoform X5 n=1 Tax=Quercus robur TaxID=38942 RepID=UPI0021624FD8|nr:cytochrome c oxidase subunit 5b-2, mitochondrial-like isoform X5 [Quercus robur]